MHLPVLHDRDQFVSIQQETGIVKWIAVDQQQVGQKTLSNLTQLIRQAHGRAAVLRHRQERFHRAEFAMPNQMVQIACIVAVWSQSEPIITTAEDPDPSPP